MNKEEACIYKDIDEQYLDKGVIRASEIVYRRIKEIISGEDDFICDPPRRIGRFLGRYQGQKEYEDGWVVKKVLIPDISTRYGRGYHSVSVVASTATTDEGVSEAVRRAAEVKVAEEKCGITRETIAVLSASIPFVDANLIRRNMNSKGNGFRTILVYSVKNALGVARAILRKLANLFGLRSKAILNLPGLRESELKSFAYRLLKRAEELGKRIEQLSIALVEMKKSGQSGMKKLIGISYGLIKKAKKMGVRFGRGRGKLWVYDEDLLDPDYLREKVNWIAEIQGIDVDYYVRKEAEAKMRALENAKRTASP